MAPPALEPLLELLDELALLSLVDEDALLLLLLLSFVLLLLVLVELSLWVLFPAALSVGAVAAALLVSVPAVVDPPVLLEES